MPVAESRPSRQLVNSRSSRTSPRRLVKRERQNIRVATAAKPIMIALAVNKPCSVVPSVITSTASMV